MVTKNALLAVIESEHSTPADKAAASAAILALDNPKPAPTPAPEPEMFVHSDVVAQMLADLELPTVQTAQEIYDENLRITPLKEAMAATPNMTGNDLQNAAEALRADPSWLATFEAQFGKNPSAPVIAQVATPEPEPVTPPEPPAPVVPSIWDTIRSLNLQDKKAL